MNSNYYLEVAYAKILGTRLERFKVKKESPFLAAARCPVCLDSATKKSKTRFCIYTKNNSLNINCFNCSLSTTLIKFLKLYEPQLFSDFISDKFRNNCSTPIITETPIPKKICTTDRSVLKLNLPLVSELPDSHIAKEYIKSRQLPEFPFYYTDSFYQFSSQYNEEFSKSNQSDESRIVIPFYNREGKIFAYQGRSLCGPTKIKYVTVKINPSAPLCFGLQLLDIKKPIFLVEGPLDSLFLPNALAGVNASLVSTANWLSTGINTNSNKAIDLTIILDNEPRSKNIVSEYEKAINSGYKTVIWPRQCESIKDINEMVLHSLDVEKIIAKNTYSGLSAQIALGQWKKI